MKSTHLKIIGGIQCADCGGILLNGGACVLNSTHDAKESGVVSVYQELTMFADRVAVMPGGHLVGELVAEDITQHNIMELCTVYQTAKAEHREAGLREKLASVLSKNKNTLILTALLLVMLAAGPLITPFFFNPANFNNMIWQTFVFILLTLGQLAVVIDGGIDLSISACMTVSAIVGMKVMLAFPNAPAAVLAAFFVITILLNILNHIGMSLYTQNIIQGAVILVVLIVYERRKKQSC